MISFQSKFQPRIKKQGEGLLNRVSIPRVYMTQINQYENHNREFIIERILFLLICYIIYIRCNYGSGDVATIKEVRGAIAPATHQVKIQTSSPVGPGGQSDTDTQLYSNFVQILKNFSGASPRNPIHKRPFITLISHQGLGIQIIVVWKHQ